MTVGPKRMVAELLGELSSTKTAEESVRTSSGRLYWHRSLWNTG